MKNKFKEPSPFFTPDELKALENQTTLRARRLVAQRDEKRTAVAANPHATDKEIASTAELVSNIDAQIADCVLKPFRARTDMHGAEVIGALMSGLSKLNATEGTVRGSDLARDDKSCLLEAGKIAGVAPDDSLSLPDYVVERMRELTK